MSEVLDTRTSAQISPQSDRRDRGGPYACLEQKAGAVGAKKPEDLRKLSSAAPRQAL
jgi:hypothetical protein